MSEIIQKNINSRNEGGNPDKKYDDGLYEQINNRKKEIKSSMRKYIIRCILTVIIIIIINIGLGWAQGELEAFINIKTSKKIVIIANIIITSIIVILPEILAIKIKFKFLSMSDAIKGIFDSGYDYRYYLKLKSLCRKSINSEVNIMSNLLDSKKTDAIKEYEEFQLKNSDAYFFKPMEEYPIADLSDENTVKEILRQEEELHYRYGVIYSSNYNKLIVDPVKDGDRIFPYERIIPAKGNGVVIVPIYEDKFILLNQSRHAIRDKQLCFPRGYAEENLSPIENAKKELLEEINAKIVEEPVLLGSITPDSGLSASMVNIYLIQIDGYSTKASYEGIHTANAYSEEELRKMIQDNKIKDGFTLSGYTLYKAYQEKYSNDK